MSVTKQINGDECEFIMPARVDGDAANNLEIEVLAAIRQGMKRIYVNFASSTFLCSAGLRVILQYNRKMRAQGGSLLVSRTSPEVDKVLELSGFRDFIVEKP